MNISISCYLPEGLSNLIYKNHPKQVNLIRTNHFHIFYCTGKPVHKTSCFPNFYFLKLWSISIFKVQDASNGSPSVCVVCMNEDLDSCRKDFLFCCYVRGFIHFNLPTISSLGKAETQRQY